MTPSFQVCRHCWFCHVTEFTPDPKGGFHIHGYRPEDYDLDKKPVWRDTNRLVAPRGLYPEMGVFFHCNSDGPVPGCEWFLEHLVSQEGTTT